MKRKSAERADWERILQRRFAVRQIDSEHFTGTIAFLFMDEVSEPLWLEDPIRVCLVDSGFLWTQHFPKGTYYALTTAFDAEELEEASREGKVSQEDYNLAWQETRRILREIEQGMFPLFKLSEEHRDLSTNF